MRSGANFGAALEGAPAKDRVRDRTRSRLPAHFPNRAWDLSRAPWDTTKELIFGGLLPSRARSFFTDPAAVQQPQLQAGTAPLVHLLFLSARQHGGTTQRPIPPAAL